MNMYVVLYYYFSVKDAWGPFPTEREALEFIDDTVENYKAPHPRADRSIYAVMPLTSV